MSTPTEDPPRLKLDEAERRRLLWRDRKRDFLLESVGKFTNEQARFLWGWLEKAVELER